MKNVEEGLSIEQRSLPPSTPKPESFRDQIRNIFNDPTLKALQEKSGEKKSNWRTFLGRRRRNLGDSPQHLSDADKQENYLDQTAAKVSQEKVRLRNENSRVTHELSQAKMEATNQRDDVDFRDKAELAENEKNSQQLEELHDQKEAEFLAEKEPAAFEQLKKGLTEQFKRYFDALMNAVRQNVIDKKYFQEKLSLAIDRLAVLSYSGVGGVLQDLINLQQEEAFFSFTEQGLTKKNESFDQQIQEPISQMWPLEKTYRDTVFPYLREKAVAKTGKLAAEIALQQAREVLQEVNVSFQDPTPQIETSITEKPDRTPVQPTPELPSQQEVTGQDIVVNREQIGATVSKLIAEDKKVKLRYLERDQPALTEIFLVTLEALKISKIKSLSFLNSGGFSNVFIVEYLGDDSKLQKIVLKIGNYDKRLQSKDDVKTGNPQYELGTLKQRLGFEKYRQLVPEKLTQNSDPYLFFDTEKLYPDKKDNQGLLPVLAMKYIPEVAAKAPEKGGARKAFLKNLLIAFSVNVWFDFNRNPELESNNTFRYDSETDQINLVDAGFVDLRRRAKEMPDQSFLPGAWESKKINATKPTSESNYLKILLENPPQITSTTLIDQDREAPLTMVMNLAKEFGYTSLAQAANDLGVTNGAAELWTFDEYNRLVDSVKKPGKP